MITRDYNSLPALYDIGHVCPPLYSKHLRDASGLLALGFAISLVRLEIDRHEKE